MNQSALGPLEPHHSNNGSLVGGVALGGRRLDLLIDPDGCELASVLALAEATVRNLLPLDSKARHVAAAKLLESYNSHWREFQRATPAGTVENVSNPILTATEFMDRLQLTSITILGNESVDFFYSDGAMFAGHSVVISSFDGARFEEADASLFG